MMAIARSQFQENMPYVLFISILLIVNIIFLAEVVGLRFTTALAPSVFIIPTIIFLILASIKILNVGNGYWERGDSNSKKVEQEMADVKQGQELPDDEKEDINAILVSSFLSISCVISVALIGFFSTSFLFTSSIIFYYKSKGNLLFDISFSIGVGLLTSLFFWYLFVVTFESTRMMRIGWFI